MEKLSFLQRTDLFCELSNLGTCGRDGNCPWEAKGFSEDLDKILRERTIAYLKRMRTLATLSFKSLMMSLMTTTDLFDNDDIDYTDQAAVSARLRELDELDKMLDSS